MTDRWDQENYYRYPTQLNQEGNDHPSVKLVSLSRLLCGRWQTVDVSFFRLCGNQWTRRRHVLLWRLYIADTGNTTLQNSLWNLALIYLLILPSSDFLTINVTLKWFPSLLLPQTVTAAYLCVPYRYLTLVESPPRQQVSRTWLARTWIKIIMTSVKTGKWFIGDLYLILKHTPLI